MLSQSGARLQVFLDLRLHNGLRQGPWELVILDDQTIERPWGWVFFYTTAGWRDGDFNYAIAGNAPYFVNRDGTMFHMGTALPTEEYIAAYESELERRSGAWELFIDEPAKCSLDVASAIRSALGMTILEFGKFKSRLPTAYASGALVDLEPICNRLVAANVHATIRKSDRCKPTD